MSTFRSHKSTLDASDFSTIVKKACGLMPQELIFKRASNIAEIVKNLEIGVYKPITFSKITKRRFINKCVPNYIVTNVVYEGPIFRSMLSLDGNVFLTATEGGSIKLYNSRDGSYEFYQEIQSSPSTYEITISPDNSCIAYINGLHDIDHPDIFLYYLTDPSLPPRKEMIFLALDLNCLLSAVFSSNGKEILLSGLDNVLIFDLTTGCPVLNFHTPWITRVTFADASSQIFYSCGIDSLIKIWDRRTLYPKYPKPVGILSGHTQNIVWVESKGDGRFLISKSRDNTIKLWDIRRMSKRIRSYSEGEKLPNEGPLRRFQSDSNLKQLKETDMSLMTYSGGHYTERCEDTRVQFSPMETTGQRYIYTTCYSGNIVVYDALTGDVVQINRTHEEGHCNVSWHPTRNEIMSSTWYGTLTKWIYREIV